MTQKALQRNMARLDRLVEADHRVLIALGIVLAMMLLVWVLVVGAE